MADRDRLKTTFDSAARFYQQARPDYPAALYDELVRVAALRAGDRLLEIGCATGKATAPLARRGFRITCVEIGTQLAAEGRRNLAVFPGVEVVEAAFETWRPSRTDAFALVFAATAWHWIDPAVKYRRAWELLRPGGHLAFWAATHVFPPGGDTFFRDIQDVYHQIGEGLPPGATWPRPGELPDDTAEIDGSGLFEPVAVRQFDWEVSYSAEEYLRLLDTFSGQQATSQFTVTVYPALQITTSTTLPAGTVGVPYSHDLTAQGGNGPRTPGSRTPDRCRPACPSVRPLQTPTTS